MYDTAQVHALSRSDSLISLSTEETDLLEGCIFKFELGGSTQQPWQWHVMTTRGQTTSSFQKFDTT